MNNSSPFLPTTRREFLHLSTKGIGLLAFSGFAPSFLVKATMAGAPAPEKDQKVLVLIQLAGGNDGLNTLIPFEDPHYYRLRPTLAIPKEKVLRVSDTLGLHPSCAAFQALVNDGKLAIVQNVGYPNPNHSHFRSSEIWETASPSDKFLSTGWIGRYLDNACAGSPAEDHDPLAVHVNTLNGVPETFMGAQEHPTFGLLASGIGRKDSEETRKLLQSIGSGGANAGDERTFLQQTLMDSLVTETKVQQVLTDYRPMSTYPANPFATSLRSVAGLIASGLPTRVYFVTLTGFDTHFNQANTQANLLTVLSTRPGRLPEGPRGAPPGRPGDNHDLLGVRAAAVRDESKGTDHGTAAPLFVLGAQVKGGLHGTAPNLDLPKNQDVAYSTDFRSVYATMLENWLGTPSEPVLGAKFAPLPLIA